MKKNLLFIAVILAIILFGCKKDPTGEPEPALLLSSKDPVELSKNVKVWHGIRLAGTPPSPTGGANAPKI